MIRVTTVKAFMSDTIFTKIIKGEIPAHKIYEDKDFVAFLDIKPINPGHTLVVPKIQVDYLFDLPHNLYVGVFEACRKLELAIRKSTNATRIGLVVYGFDVPHAHIHLVPLYMGGELDFKLAKMAESRELAKMAELIKSYL